jgi:hypothetical protein
MVAEGFRTSLTAKDHFLPQTDRTRGADAGAASLLPRSGTKVTSNAEKWKSRGMVIYVQGSREHGALEMDKVKPPRTQEKEWDRLSDRLAANQSTVKRELYGLYSTVVLRKLFRNQRSDVQLDDWISMSLCLSRTLHMACRVLQAAIRW